MLAALSRFCFLVQLSEILEGTISDEVMDDLELRTHFTPWISYSSLDSYPLTDH